jgi:hypothetical protein
MMHPDTDRALRPDDGRLYLHHDSTRDRDHHGPRERRLDNGIGSIQIVRPLRATASDSAEASSYDDDLSAARGMALGVALGLGIWCLIGGLIGFFII